MSQHHERIKNDPRWHAARADALDRDGHACVECGATTGLQVDHVVRLADDGDPFDLDNLQVLCLPHHQQKERDYEKNRLIRTTWLNPRYPELKPLVEQQLQVETETTGPVF